MKQRALVCMMCMATILCLTVLVRPAVSQDKVISLKYATHFPPMSPMAGVAESWCKEVEKRTQGKVKIKFFAGGTLTPTLQSYQAAVTGITDISMTSAQWNAGRFPLTEVIHLPLGTKSSLQGTKLINAWYKKFKPKEFDDVKVLFHFTSGPTHFMTKKQISSISDLKGMKIRAAGDTSKIVSAMGAVPVSIPFADAYEAFQRGIAEGTIIAAEALKAFKWSDLLKGLQINEGMGNVISLSLVMNKGKWNSLPPDIQKTIEQINEEWLIKTGKAWDDIDKDALDDSIKTKGLKIFRISKEEEAKTARLMQPIIDEYVARMKKQNLPGEESLKFCLDWLKANPQP